MTPVWKWLRNLVFILPAEWSHHLGLIFIRMVGSLFGPLLRPSKKTPHLNLSFKRSIFDHALHRVGLAAGFDKNAQVVEHLPAFGFGFAEIGTVTPRPQGGNERPRLFRDPKREALLNRMGFNNLGAGLVSENLRRARPKLPNGFLVGVNLGKNKTTPNAQAHLDYSSVAQSFLDCADYFVVNISSPNTPGLRDLQTPEHLGLILSSVQNVLSQSSRRTSLWVKFAPELSRDDLEGLITVAKNNNLDGLILTNTLKSEVFADGVTYAVGLSGAPLKQRAEEVLSWAVQDGRLPVVSVGGIQTAHDVSLRLKAGAVAVQVYSHWVYGGPFWPKTLKMR